MEKSLNSTRNFKLPPIQGAVPAANILRQPSAPKPYSWPHGKERSTASLPRHRFSTVKTRQVIQVASDPFPGRYRSPHNEHNHANSTVQRSVFNRAIENEKNEELTLDFAPLVHQFPQTYNVLPPIQKDPKPIVSLKAGTAAPFNHLIDEKRKTEIQYKSAALDATKLNADKQLKQDSAQKPRDKRARKESNTKTNDNSNSSLVARDASQNKHRVDGERLEKETGERKQSSTTVLFLKGKRRGRRVGVCLENEPALINVTEQLKEIFLRRNMEEMYLI